MRLQRGTSASARLLRMAGWPLLISLLAACGDGDTPIGPAEATACTPDPVGSIEFQPLPVRAPPPGVTTGAVPHRQINTVIIPSVIEELHERIFALSDVESRESAVQVGTGVAAIRISPEVNIARPECVVIGREVAHIHLDGSLHAVLPHGRVPDAESAGWGELHPFAETEPDLEVFVLLFSPRSSEEVDVILDLVLEGLAFLKGET